MEAAGTGTAPGGCASAREAAEAPGSPALPSRREEVEEEREAAGPCRGRASGRRGAEAGGGRGRGGRRPPRVTVDSSKAKTSLEALKISLRQLRWREVGAGGAAARPGGGRGGWRHGKRRIGAELGVLNSSREA